MDCPALDLLMWNKYWMAHQWTQYRDLAAVLCEISLDATLFDEEWCCGQLLLQSFIELSNMVN